MISSPSTRRCDRCSDCHVATNRCSIRCAAGVTISVVAIAGAASFPREHCHDDRHLTVAVAHASRGVGVVVAVAVGVAVAGALDGERGSADGTGDRAALQRRRDRRGVQRVTTCSGRGCVAHRRALEAHVPGARGDDDVRDGVAHGARHANAELLARLADPHDRRSVRHAAAEAHALAGAAGVEGRLFCEAAVAQRADLTARARIRDEAPGRGREPYAPDVVVVPVRCELAADARDHVPGFVPELGRIEDQVAARVRDRRALTHEVVRVRVEDEVVGGGRINVRDVHPLSGQPELVLVAPAGDDALIRTDLVWGHERRELVVVVAARLDQTEGALRPG